LRKEFVIEIRERIVAKKGGETFLVSPPGCGERRNLSDYIITEYYDSFQLSLIKYIAKKILAKEEFFFHRHGPRCQIGPGPDRRTPQNLRNQNFYNK
jgi:hypothetical protein